jgi:hypothetical protein
MRSHTTSFVIEELTGSQYAQPISCIHFALRANAWAYLARGGVISIRGTEEWNELLRINLSEYATRVTLFPSGNRVAIAISTGDIFIHDINSGSLIAVYHLESAPLALCITPDERAMLAVTSRRVSHTDLQSGKEYTARTFDQDVLASTIDPVECVIVVALLTAAQRRSSFVYL